MMRINLGIKKCGLRKTGQVIFVLIDVFLWYYLTISTMTIISRDIKVEQTEFLPFHSLGVIIGGITGILFSRYQRKILFLWTFLGIATSLLPLFVPISTLLHFQFICFAWGFSLGWGMPLCLGYFAENTTIEKRGRFSGIVFLISLFCAIPLTSLTYSFDLTELYLILGLLRLLGLIPLLILRNENEEIKFKKNSAATTYDGRLYFYLVPWLMFNIVDGLEELLLRDFVKAAFPDYYILLQLIGLLFASTFAFLGGLLCDLIGRKPVTIFGFAIMGIVYAIISIVPRTLLAWFLFYICDGFSWGLFYTIFIMVIWGDLAPKGSEEKYYFIGNVPFFLAAIVQKFFAEYVMFLGATNAFSLAALFLFLAVVPLMFAPETLPEKAIRERELRRYIEKAKKIKEKFT